MPKKVKMCKCGHKERLHDGKGCYDLFFLQRNSMNATGPWRKMKTIPHKCVGGKEYLLAWGPGSYSCGSWVCKKCWDRKEGWHVEGHDNPLDDSNFVAWAEIKEPK